jgi:DNA-binding transcriptional MocR family regulator
LAFTQFEACPGIVDLAWGHPPPSALPVDAWAESCTEALRAFGPRALTYGYANGPGPLVEWLCERLGRTDVRAPRPDEVFVTAGASHALELVCALLVRTGDTVLVDSPTYHLALRIIGDHTADLVPVPVDEDGIDPVGTERLIHHLRGEGRRIPLLYLVPTFNNPTGACLPPDRRGALVEVARRTGVTIVEDDTYRELAYDGTAPPSLYGIGDGYAVIRVGSFAKTVAPGLRLGWLNASAELVRRIAARGYIDSGGGVNHTTAATMAVFGSSGRYERHVTVIRALYRAHRDELVSVARREFGHSSCGVPGGGWFLWLRLPPGVDSTLLLPHAEANGVSYVPGARFYRSSGGNGRGYLRLSFSMCEPDLLAEGVRRLAAAVGSAPTGHFPKPGHVGTL